MMKISLLTGVCCLVSILSIAQPREIFLKSSDKGFYVEHKVVSKDNFYSIGRLYNVPAKEIAAFNKLDMNKGLNIDQVIRIPLTTTNFSQTADEGAPVYYKSKDKEDLKKVSSAANNVPLTNLRRWNGFIKSDDLTPGSKVIVGFLVSSQLPSVETIIKGDIMAPLDTREDKNAVIVNESNKQQPIDNKQSATSNKQPVTSNLPADRQGKQQATSNKQPATTEEGYFKSSFEQQSKAIPVSKSETVTAGIFKTTSGWQDAKYYLLIDAVQPGTIVKVINPTNNKAVYAKALGEMVGIRQNEGLNIRISNAAAAALQITDIDKFVVKVSY